MLVDEGTWVRQVNESRAKKRAAAEEASISMLDPIKDYISRVQNHIASEVVARPPPRSAGHDETDGSAQRRALNNQDNTPMHCRAVSLPASRLSHD